MADYKAYAGIGSRTTPTHILDLMTKLANKLEQDGWTLRSGGAKGADSAFEQGVSLGNKEIFTVNNLIGKLGEEAHATVDRYHPRPDWLNSYSRDLMARNAFQVLGSDLRQPSLFVVCWAPQSKWDSRNRIKSVKGGTGQAVRIAYDNNIEILNLSEDIHLQKINKYINKK